MAEQDNGEPAAAAPKLMSAEITRSANGEVDVEKIRLKLLIICRSKPALDAVANYLNRRGWETFVTRDIKEAFKIISSQKPDFVLVSVNIHSPKVVTLPQVIFQTFKTRVITFGESLNTKTLKGLQTINTNYKMPGALSGPSVHRRLKQILQELFAPEARPASPEDDPAVAAAVEAPHEVRKKKKKGYTIVESEGGPAKEKSNMMRFSNDDKPKGPDGYIPKVDTSATAEEEKEDEDTNADLDLESLVSEYGKTSVSEKQKQDIGRVLGMNMDEKGVNQNQSFRDEKVRGDSQFAGAEKDKASTAAETAPSSYRDGVFEKIAEIARDSALPVTDEAAPFKAAPECTIISLKFATRSSYIVVFVEGAVHDEIQYISRFQANLNEHLPKDIEKVEIRDPVRVRMDFDKNKFFDETDKKSFSFSMKSGMGYVHVYMIHSTEYSPQISDAPDADKARIEPTELVTNLPAGVEVFLYLPKNDRHYLYLKPESAINEEQKERLVSREAQVFIDKDAVETYIENSQRNKTLERLATPSKDKKVA